MEGSKADRIAALQREILLMQGFRPSSYEADDDCGLGPIRHAFPQSRFPRGAVHEFICHRPEEASASLGFIAGILSSLVKNGGAALWVATARHVFPPALKGFGIDPDGILFIQCASDKEKLWVVEEALKCEGLAAVVGEIDALGFTESRRLQLAVEQSRVTGFLLRRQPRNLSTACVTRWEIKPLATEEGRPLPGLGFPRWNVRLQKVRNGKPGSWEMEWKGGRFHLVQKPLLAVAEPRRKTG